MYVRRVGVIRTLVQCMPILEFALAVVKVSRRSVEEVILLEVKNLYTSVNSRKNLSGAPCCISIFGLLRSAARSPTIQVYGRKAQQQCCERSLLTVACRCASAVHAPFYQYFALYTQVTNRIMTPSCSYLEPESTHALQVARSTVQHLGNSTVCWELTK
jgi:hypothetical protein